MKKRVIILLCLILVCALAGCGNSKTEVGVHEYTEDRLADNGKVLASCRYEVPEMTHGPGLEKFNQFYQQWLSKQIAWFNEVAGMASADYDLCCDTPEEWLDSFYYQDHVKTTIFQNKHMLCVVMDSYSFTGGIHGISAKSAHCFDIATGEEIQLLEMTKDYSGLQKVVRNKIYQDIISSDVFSSKSENGFFDDFEETIEQWESRTIYFEPEGMHVVFGVYDIATYGAGEQNFLISYDLITPFINDQAKAYLELK